MGTEIKQEYKDIFEPIPHANRLPEDIYCEIRLKDATKLITTRTYSCLWKYKQAWTTLIQQHLDAGRIHPSNSQHASPAFLIPKTDTAVLPRWVNDYRALNTNTVIDYRALNTNTVIDSYPLPRVDDILADCGKGKIWSVLDMTNSFLQTRMHPDSIPLTAVTIPFGLYEWLVMPMGLRNAPPIHQRRMMAALRDQIGKWCHIYLDDIIVFSDTIEEHTQHLRLVLDVLRKAPLYANPKKCKFYQLEVDFLGHHLSQRGIEANSSKVEHILQWPTPKNATDVRSFLELTRYVAVFLPKLAEFMRILTPLTTKEARKSFPEWSEHVSLTHTSLGIPWRDHGGSTEGVRREYGVGKEWVRSE
jgi:hypothetical protein